jgi:hypothetical protein
MAEPFKSMLFVVSPKENATGLQFLRLFALCMMETGETFEVFR